MKFKNKRLLVLLVSIVLLITLTLPLTMSCTGETTPTETPVEKIVLKTVFPFNYTSGDMYLPRRMVEESLERSDGRLEIQYLGGPEVIPSANLFESVINGRIDIGWTSPGNQEVSMKHYRVSHTSPYTYTEERAMGIHDYWNKFFKDTFNVYWLGSWNKGHKFGFVSRVPFATPQDLKGLKMSASGVMFQYPVEVLGIVPATVALSDLYNALQQGVLDCSSFTTIAYSAVLKLWEVADYYTADTVFGGSGLHGQVNMDVWNSLPPDMQAMIDDWQRELELDTEIFMREDDQKSFQLFDENGMTGVHFSDADRVYWNNLCNDGIWEHVVKDELDPETYAELKAVYQYPYK